MRMARTWRGAIVHAAVVGAGAAVRLPLGTRDEIATRPLSDDDDGERGSRDESCLRARAGAGEDPGAAQRQGDNDPKSASDESQSVALDAEDDGGEGAGDDRRKEQQEAANRRARRRRRHRRRRCPPLCSKSIRDDEKERSFVFAFSRLLAVAQKLLAPPIVRACPCAAGSTLFAV